MTRPLLLESFDGVQTSSSESADGLVEEKWLEAFEKGYKDGWEDAESALTRRQAHITDAFAQNLQDLGFTLGEARAAVRKEVSALLKGVLETMLPEILHHLLGPQILSELEAFAGQSSDVVIGIHVFPDQSAAVSRALSGVANAQVQVVADENVALNTALLKFASAEREIDLNAALLDMAETLAPYFEEHGQYEETAYG